LCFFSSQLFTTPPRLLNVILNRSVSMVRVSSFCAATGGAAVSESAASEAGAAAVSAGAAGALGGAGAGALVVETGAVFFTGGVTVL
jgi:hypothetical protein